MSRSSRSMGRTLSSIAFTAALALGTPLPTSGCTAKEQPPPATATPAGEPTFGAILGTIFAPSTAGNCVVASCHGGVAAPGTNGNLHLSATDQTASWSALVGAISTSPHCMGRPYVVPGQPEQSLLYRKLAGMQECGTQMPLIPVGALLTPGQLEQVRLWIAMGATNTGGALGAGGAGGAGGIGGAAGMAGMGGMGGAAGMF